jgi:acetate---CoA ligase (ADP-forming)
MPNRLSSHDALHALFHPRAVAVIGASDDTTKHGYIVLNNVRDTGFRGGVYGISRRLTDVNGIPCFPDLASAPEQVDVAFLAIPAEAAVRAVRDCAAAGLKAAIVGSAGYAESLDAAGTERQTELARIAQEAGIRIVGPNCNGIYNAHCPVSIGFNTSHAKRQPPGGISIFSHSGALFDAMAGRLAMLDAGLSLFASAGNEADLSVLDYMEYAIGHEPTRVIALLIDSLNDGRRFRRLALAAADAGKHVVVLKIGGSAAGAKAAVAHSSRLAGDSAAYNALFQASGVAVASSLEGFMTASAMLNKYGRRRGRLGAMSTSGAGASLIADRCAALHVALSEFAPETHQRIDDQRKFSRIGNPLDLGIFGGMRRAAQVPSLLADDPDVGAMLALVHSMNPWQGDPIRAALANAREASRKPLLIVAPGGMPATERAWYESRGMDVFTETDIALESIGAMLTPPPVPLPPVDTSFAPDLPQRALTEPESLALLRTFRVPVVTTVECATLEQARTAAAQVGWPVVLKGVVEGVGHKSELGLVRTNLRDDAALQSAFTSIGSARLIVQPMVPAAFEAIAGVARSPGVGLVLLAGLGGIYTEGLRQACVWPVPVGREAIEQGVANSGLGGVLCSARWQYRDTIAAFVELLCALQRAAITLGDQLEAIDINPVMLGEYGALAVDALVVPRT